MYNAVVHDEDYRQTRERDADARLNRIWFGSGQALKVKALAVAGAMAKAPPPEGSPLLEFEAPERPG